MSLGKKLTAEAMGTFMLCFVGASAICMTTKMGGEGPGLLGVAIAHGIALSVAVSATMNVSGGHVNPAVTLSLLITGRIGLAEAIPYIVAQCLGATAAGVLTLLIFNGMSTPGGMDVIAAATLGTPTYDTASLSMGRAILIEAGLTFLLVFAVFGTAVHPNAPKIGGFGIGLTICADILMGGPLTGAAMNPARTFGPGIVAFFSGNFAGFWSQHVVYWIGPVAGGAMAAIIYDKLVIGKKA